MEVSFNVTKQSLIELRLAFEQDIAVLEVAIADLRDNIGRIEQALNPVRRTTVTSSDGMHLYSVTKTYVSGFAPGAATYECSCPSFQYNRGLDERSRCKHIRKSQEEGF